MQITQQVFVAEECIRNTHNKYKAESSFRHEVEKAVGSVKEEKTQLAEKLKTSKHECLSTVAGLKTIEKQAVDQRKLLFTTELNLATEKATILSLKAELEKAKAEAQAVKEAAKAAETTAYEQGMLETEQRLAEEVVEVCRDYCTVTWNEALNSARVPADSKLRRAERVYFPEHIKEIPIDPSSAALPLPPLEQIPNAQDPTIDVGTSTEAGMGKEDLPSSSDVPSEDTLTIRDVISQAKEVEKPIDEDARSKTATTKEDPYPKKKQLQDFIFLVFSS